MRFPGFPLLQLLIASAIFVAPSHALPPPMEPASRTLFLFVHGVNPRSKGAIESVDSCATGSKSCNQQFCVGFEERRGDAALSWVRDLDEKASDDAIFCSMKKRVFGKQYSLRSFSDPGESPTTLAHELGDRTWKNESAGLRSHVIEAMRRYLEAKRDTAAAWKPPRPLRSDFEMKLLSLYPTGAIDDLKAIFEAYPDSIPSRVVVFAHSMGGLTTREYLMSDFYNGDVDKVVTYDTPHNGSWSGLYNQDGSWNAGKAMVEDGAKIVIGSSLLALPVEEADKMGLFYLISGISSTSAGFATQFAGKVANGFVGNEKANWYLPPNSSDLRALNAKTSLPCERDGCRVPSFQLHGVDGVLSPDDPSKFIGTGVAGYVLPLEAVDAASAFVMAYDRSWPSSLSKDQVLGASMVAGSFAFGGWNFSQHGSLVVPLNSSHADGIPFLSRPDVMRSWRQVDWEKEGRPQFGGVKKAVGDWTGLSGHLIAITALTTIAKVQPWLTPAMGVTKIAIGFAVGGSFAADMAAYASAAGPSHNSTIWLNATRRDSSGFTRADGSKAMLRFTQAESDLYEAPFAQIARIKTPGESDTIFRLAMNTGEDSAKAYGITVPGRLVQEIRYLQAGWNERWAVRDERHMPVQDSSTKVREVKRWNLPVELLTTEQISSLDFQIDDLRPDLMEQMEVVLNYGMHRIVWDREYDPAGNALGTFTVTYLANGTPTTPLRGVANPIDAYGRWHVPLRKLIPPHLQVLIDGQNLLGVSLLNHVGKYSAQRQFLTFQATPPVVSMSFPRPFSTISDASVPACFEANLLYYGGIAFDTSDAGWILTREMPWVERDTTKPVALIAIPGLAASESQQRLCLPLWQGFGASPKDGEWTLGIRVNSLQPLSGQSGAAAMRRFPFWLDRTAPVFHVETQAHSSGEPWRFRVTWTDAPEGLSDVVQLARLRVRDSAGAVVAELPPVEFATGGGMVASWDGKIKGNPAPDGRYALEIVGKDGAVPDKDMEGLVLALRRELQDSIGAGGKIWTSRRDSLWNKLRITPKMNWGVGVDTFVVDHTPPEVVAGTLPQRILGLRDRLSLQFSVSDRGASIKRDSIHVRLVFHGAGFAFASSLVVPDVSGDSSIPTRALFSESNEPNGMVPDGVWTVSVVSKDADGNVDSFDLAGALRIDRLPPMFKHLTPSSSYVSSSAARIEGDVGIEAKDAASVEAEWVDPNGKRSPAQVRFVGDGEWRVDYPQEMRTAPGAWILEAIARDAAGNRSNGSTFVQVDMVPPRIIAPDVVHGPVVLKGIAMDPVLDKRRFASYELSWREEGMTEWSHEGLRVPYGRGSDSAPWRSTVEQTVEGVLGFWDPPATTGSIALRIVVVDDSGMEWSATCDAYVSVRDSSSFSVKMSVQPDSLAAGVGARIGFDVESSEKDGTYDAQSVLVDSRRAPLWVAHRKGLHATPLEGRPSGLLPGAIHLWREEGAWHLRAVGACRSFVVGVQTWSSDTLPVACPSAWKCNQRSIPNAGYSVYGESLQVNRLIEWTIPKGSADSLSLALTNPGRVVFMPQGDGVSCAPNADCDTASLAAILPAPGELRLGGYAVPVREGTAAISMNAGQGSLSESWDGFRIDGNWPDGDSATLETDVWDASSWRVVHVRTKLALRSGTLRLGAKALGGVSMALDAPSVQKRAALEFTVEGRGASVTTRILGNGNIVRELEGSGRWREGRSAALPYRLEWDGTDAQGNPVSPGRYVFEVEADSLRARAEVVVEGAAWKEDPTLMPSIAPGEATWNDALKAWKLEPPPLLQVGTGVEGSVNGGKFQYQAQYEGTQNVLAFRMQRPSLMVRRKRERVKFGLIWKITTQQRGYDSHKQFMTNCHNDGGTQYVTHYSHGGIVEIGRGEIVSRAVQVHVRPNLGERTFRMLMGPHVVEYVAVPINFYAQYDGKQITDRIWDRAIENRLSRGSFTINNLDVSPVYGTSDIKQVFSTQGWASEPLPPRACDSTKFQDQDGDGILSQSEWQNKACKEDFADDEVVNPNRNLIHYGVRSIRMLPSVLENDAGLRILLSAVGVGVNSFVWADGKKGPVCATNKLTDFRFDFDIKVPDAFFDAKPGVDNLANRLLRFDPENHFLYGPNGFLMKDGYDNDGNGEIDDAAEASGYISPFETRSYQWRPVLEDVLDTRKQCKSGKQYRVSYGSEALMGRLLGKRMTPVGEPSSCTPRSDSLCQSWRMEDSRFCTPDEGNDPSSNILQDKLNFFEGDHFHQQDDQLLAWFANTPEQGDASFVATIRQKDKVWTVDSRTENAPESAKRIAIQRGHSMTSAQRAPMFAPDPVQFTVGMRSSQADLGASSGDMVRIAWPLDSNGWLAEKSRIEGACRRSAFDSTSCRRIHAAASGVRFGLNDGLDPGVPGTAWGSLLQSAFFKKRASGAPANPDALPEGRIPDGRAVLELEGIMNAGAPGRSVFVDSIHYRAPWEGLPSNIDSVHAIPQVLGEELQVEGPDEAGHVRIAGSAATPWSLVQDPRVRGEHLEASLRWTSGTLRDVVPLLDLYRASATLRFMGSDEMALFRASTDGTLSPNEATLFRIRLRDPFVRWRDGSDASRVFEAATRSSSLAEYPQGLELQRTSAVERLPEWVAIRGAVPEGSRYQLGWSVSGGGWHPFGDARLSTCRSLETIQGTCTLGLVDAGLLPDRGQIVLRIDDSSRTRFGAFPFVRGSTIASTGGHVVRSLFGDAQVVFPDGALKGKSETDRTISIRVLSPKDVGLGGAASVFVLGPVVEITPSQTFANGAYPEVVLRVARSVLGGTKVDPSSVRLYKVDAASGTSIPLEAQTRMYVCGGRACGVDDDWSEIEFHGKTSSFSRFALLPSNTPDSRMWSASIQPAIAASRERRIDLRGIDIGDVSMRWDDDPSMEDEGDVTPSMEAVVRPDGLSWFVDAPLRPVSWLLVRRKGPGIARALRVEMLDGEFRFRSLAPDTLFVGRAGSAIRIPYEASRRGELRMMVHDAGKDIAWAVDSMDAPGGSWSFNVPVDWEELPSIVSTRIVATDMAGQSVVYDGPVLAFDRTRPVASITASLVRSRDAWNLRVQPKAMDDREIASISLRIFTSDGFELGRWNDLEERELSLPDSIWASDFSRELHVDLEAVDRAGNRSEASWSSSFAARKREVLLWLRPSGTGEQGWNVEDIGRHRLHTRILGLSSWRDEALAFLEPETRVLTQAVGDSGVEEATMEIFGVWDSSVSLLERTGEWSLRRDGHDAVFRAGTFETRWASVFPASPSWLHLCLVMDTSGLVLYRDGRPFGARAWTGRPSWTRELPWSAGGGGAAARFGLVRVWNTAFDSLDVAMWRREALGIDSVEWIEAESMTEDVAQWRPHCELPSRLAVAPDDSARTLRTTVSGPRRVHLGGRWIADAMARVSVMMDGQPMDTAALEPMLWWGPLAAWHGDTGVAELSIPHGLHELAFQVPGGVQLDGFALVSGDGRIDRWTPPDPPSEKPSVEVMVRDESPSDPNHFKPRILVRNMSDRPLQGYRLHMQVRSEAWRPPVVDVWGYPSSAWSLFHDKHGLFTWTMDRGATVLAPKQSDFSGAGVPIGFHLYDWSAWTRSDDPSWDSSWLSGGWTNGYGIPVFSKSGQLLSEWRCRDGADLSQASSLPFAEAVLGSTTPLLLTADYARVTALSEGNWAWTSTVIGISPLDGNPLTGTLRWGDRNWTLSGWWQQITIPNASRSEFTFELDLGSARKVQLQKWHQ